MPLRESLRDGSISLSVAKRLGRDSGGPAEFSNKTLRQTRAQKSKETEFENKSKSDEYRPSSGALSKREINEREYQSTPSYAMPSAAAGRAATTPPAARSRSPQGGRVGASDTPSRGHLDEFPRGIGKTFPAGGNYAGPPSPKTGNTKMKGKQPAKSGGPEGHNARSPRYYGGPNRRMRENG